MVLFWITGLIVWGLSNAQNAGQDAEKRSLKVVSVLAPPFLIQRADGSYDGYSVDLAHLLGNVIGVNMSMYHSPDNKFGVRDKHGQWDGMIGELVRKNADAAIGPITITSMRERVVDFTKPFMTTGITMVGLKRPRILYEDITGDSIVLFLRPFRASVWVIVIISFVATGILVGIIERMTGGRNVSPQDDICLGFWWTIQAFALQGFFHGPRSLGARTLLVFWFSFSVITVSMYIASLVNFLGGEVDILEHLSAGKRPKYVRRANRIRTFDQLSRQGNVQYSVVDGGPTESFFRTSRHQTYENMWETMNAHANTRIRDIETGMERIRREGGEFIFLCESMLASYYVNNEPCDLQLIGDPINSAGYGVATPVGSKYRDLLSLAVLSLHEEGKLLKLKRKWFLDKCEEDAPTLEIDNDVGLMLGRSVDTRQFGGIAIFLLSGMIAGGIVAGVEYRKKNLTKRTADETQLEEQNSLRENKA